MQAKLKICSMCPPENNLRHIWKTFRDEVSGEKVMLCKTHAMIKVAKKQIAMKQDGVAEKDEVFFKYVWDNSDHHCAECGKELKEFKRWWIHHLLPKAKYKYFRWDIRNTIILCYDHHNQIESAISAPKLKVFKYCESMKKELLASINIEYSPK
jgi:hypothetical protein